MKKILLSLKLVILAITISSGLQAQTCWELVWAEEFNYTGFPDPAIWTHETGGGGWGNNELQYYKANDQDNAWVADGKLTITAIKEDYGGRNYTSARIITRDKYSVKYGKIEARMKLPYGQGIWPAFWGLGQNHATVGWPASGEIDIMEMVGGSASGRDNTTHSTLHWDNNGNRASYGKSYTLPTGIFADDYHLFYITWDEQYIRAFIDDIPTPFFTMDIRGAAVSEFHQDFFLILNMAVGGNWPGAPNASTVFPQKFEIDYIRVYKKSTDVAKFTIGGADNIPPMSTSEFTLPAGFGWTYEWTVPQDAEIVSGQGTNQLEVTWGCQPGEVLCTVTGTCGTYSFKKEVGIQRTITGPMFIAQNGTNIVLSTQPAEETTFEWVLPSDATIVSGQGTHTITVNWGSIFNDVTLITENTCGKTETTFTVIKAGQYPYPDINQPNVIPGVIESVNFDYGGAGVSYHDSNNGNSGNGPRKDTNVDTEYGDAGQPNVGWIIAGEWLEYTVGVESAGWYSVSARLATNNASGGPFSVLFNGKESIKGVTISNTGGWTSFTTKKLGTVYLTPEDTLMRVNFTGGGFNMGKITITTTTDPTSVGEVTALPEIEVFPVPAHQSVTVSCNERISTITILETSGRVVRQQQAAQATTVEVDLNGLPEGIYLMRIENENQVLGHKRIVKMK